MKKITINIDFNDPENVVRIRRILGKPNGEKLTATDIKNFLKHGFNNPSRAK